MKAMILAAGRGERLRPLTDTIPKPLVPIAGKPLIEYHIERLGKAGIQDIVINVSYLGEKIIDALGDGKEFGVNIQYSKEPEPLEVAGGIINALPLLGNGAFLIVNADVWTDYPFEKLIQKAAHLSKLAHIILVNNLAKHPEGDFGLEGEQLFSDSSHPKLTYSGIGIYTPEFFEDYHPGKLPLRPILEKAIRENIISAEHYTGEFNDIGTLASWEELNTFLANKK